MASDRCIFTKEVGWSPDRVVMNENSIWNSIRKSEGVLLYEYTIACVILSGGRTSSTSYLQKKIVLSKIVPDEILKIKYCLVEKNKKKRENYICLWKTSMISIRATEVNLVKQIVINNSGRMKLLTIFDRWVLPKKKWR